MRRDYIPTGVKHRAGAAAAWRYVPPCRCLTTMMEDGVEEEPLFALTNDESGTRMCHHLGAKRKRSDERTEPFSIRSLPRSPARPLSLPHSAPTASERKKGESTRMWKCSAATRAPPAVPCSLASCGRPVIYCSSHCHISGESTISLKSGCNFQLAIKRRYYVE